MPMLITMTFPPSFSFKRTAISSAHASKGLTILGTPSRINVCLTGSILISVVSGTCLIQTKIFILSTSVL